MKVYMKKHYFYADDWDLMKKLMRKGIRLYCEEQGLSNDKDFRIVSLTTNSRWGHILNFSRCCDYPLNQDRKWEPFDAFYGKVYCDEDQVKNVIPKNDKLKEILKQIRDSGIDSKTIINALVNKNESMNLDEAKQILEDNGFVLDQLAELGVDVNNGIQDMEQTTAYEINVNNPVCPCCGQKLHFTNQDVQTDEFIGESTLNERWENEYLTNRVQDIASQLYEEELADVQPEVDRNGNITQEYLERFEYNSPSLKKAVKRAATKLSNDLAEDGFKINAWYCEQEIFEALKYYAKGFGGK